MQDFDREIDRSGTEATKWERYRERLGDAQIPMWIADMDLPCSEAISKALVRRAGHPIYGYTDRDDSYYRLFADRFHECHSYEITKEDVILSTGVMYSIACAIRLFSREGDGVLILSPSYAPFVQAIENSGRRVYRSELKKGRAGFEIDFEDLKAKLSQVSLFLLCNPHNPTGRVFGREELRRMAALCEEYQVRILSDEIHCDIVYPEAHFEPIMNVSSWAKENCVSCVSPAKSFNIAGLKVSAAIIKNREMNGRFRKEAAAIGISSINLFAMRAVKAAYTQSREWQKENLKYLDQNRNYTEAFLNRELPFVSYYKPEGTYFYWLDFSKYKSSVKMGNLFFERGLILSAGTEFSEACASFCRLNFACSRAQLEKALTVMREVLQKEELL